MFVELKLYSFSRFRQKHFQFRERIVLLTSSMLQHYVTVILNLNRIEQDASNNQSYY